MQTRACWPNSRVRICRSPFLHIYTLRPGVYSFAEFIFHALASIYMLVALEVERYFAILKRFLHLTREAKSLLWKVILVIWILAGVLSAPGYAITFLSEQYAWKNAAIMNGTNEIPVCLKTLT